MKKEGLPNSKILQETSVHRFLIRGDVFMDFKDTNEPTKPKRLRLLKEANPRAMIVKKAGASASWGRGRMLYLLPSHLHQRVPLILGCKSEVERIGLYDREHDLGLDRIYNSPAFQRAFPLHTRCPLRMHHVR